MHKIWFLLIVILSSSGCTNLIAGRFADSLGNAILNQDDPGIIKEGAPAYLLLLDSVVIDNPKNPSVLRASATLYGTYATVFVSEPERAKKMATKARNQARTAICQKHPQICKSEKKPLDEFRKNTLKVNKRNIALLYTYGTTWAGWIKTHSDDWSALAEVPRVEAVMERIIEIDPSYEWGRAHLYLGIINSQLPPALGGKPEKGRDYFEKAITISNGEDLIAKVEYARNYARLVFDQDLHDKLLNEVMSAEADIFNLTLSNTLAKQEAQKLLADSAEYFEE